MLASWPSGRVREPGRSACSADSTWDISRLCRAVSWLQPLGRCRARYSLGSERHRAKSVDPPAPSTPSSRSSRLLQRDGLEMDRTTRVHTSAQERDGFAVGKGRNGDVDRWRRGLVRRDVREQRRPGVCCSLFAKVRNSRQRHKLAQARSPPRSGYPYRGGLGRFRLGTR